MYPSSCQYLESERNGVRHDSLLRALPDNIDGTCPYFGIMTTDGKTASERAIDTEDNGFTFRRQNS